MGDLVFAHQPAQRVLQLGLLDEQVVLGVEAGRVLRALEVERQPFLHALQPRPLGQVHEQRQVEHQRRRQDRVPAEEVDLQLHRVVQPPEDVDVVPPLLVVAPRRIIVDPHLVVDVAIELRVQLRLQDGVQHTELGFFLGLEAFRVVQHLAVAIAEDIGRVPAGQAQHPGLDHRRDHRLQQSLAGLEVLAADRHAQLVGQLHHHRRIDRQVRRPVGERDAFQHRRIGIDPRRRDRDVVGRQRRVERLAGLVGGGAFHEDLGGGGPDEHQAVAVVLGLEVTHVLADHLHQTHLGVGALDVLTLEPLDVVLVEHGRHRLDTLQQIGDRLDMVVAVEHATPDGRVIGVFLDRIPRPEHDVVQVGQRHEVLDQRRLAVGALAQPDGASLGDGADRVGGPTPRMLDPGDQRRGDGAQAAEQDAQLALGGCDVVLVRFHEVSGLQIDALSPGQ